VTGPGSVTLRVWQVAGRDVPAALLHSRRLASAMRHDPDVHFSKVLGTADDRFSPRGATPTRWAALASRRDGGTVPVTDAQWWDRHAVETATLHLRPLRSRGRWSGHAPFCTDPQVGDGDATGAQVWDGRVVVVTRSTLRVRTSPRFYRAIPAVAAQLRRAPGVVVAFGIGEAPVLTQGTVSVWESASHVDALLAQTGPHAGAIRATTSIGWYAEELFARFALLAAAGSIGGTRLDDRPDV
jgi:hypothetical protein